MVRSRTTHLTRLGVTRRDWPESPPQAKPDGATLILVRICKVRVRSLRHKPEMREPQLTRKINNRQEKPKQLVEELG